MSLLELQTGAGTLPCGHPCDASNVRYERSNGQRRCVACARERNRRWRHRHPRHVGMTVEQQRQCFPFAALERYLHTSEPTELAGLLGINVRQVFRLRDSGLTEAQADQIACHLGLTPALVPGWDWEAGAEAVIDLALDEDGATAQGSLFDLARFGGAS